MEGQINFNNEPLVRVHEFQLVYSGPSFESGIKIESLIENLRSIRELIYSIVDTNSEYDKGSNTSKDVREIKVVIKNGSILENISIVFTNPEIRATVISVLISLIFYLRGRADSNRAEERQNLRLDKIEDLIAQNQLKNVKKLYEPLGKLNDSFKIVEDNQVKLEVNFTEKEDINKAIKKVEKELKTEESTEDLEGYVSAVDLDTGRLRFHSRDLDKSCPLDFDQPLASIMPIFGKRISAKMRVFKFKERIRRFKLVDYKVIQTELRDFGK